MSGNEDKRFAGASFSHIFTPHWPSGCPFTADTTVALQASNKHCYPHCLFLAYILYT